MLGLTERSVVAVLFSETRLEPISYRRVTFLLKKLRHLADLGNERLVKTDLLHSLDLARQLKLSWVNDIVIVLAGLPIPVYWKVSDGLVADAKEACIHARLSAYSRTRLLENPGFATGPVGDGGWQIGPQSARVPHISTCEKQQAQGGINPCSPLRTCSGNGADTMG
ncbi:hypothetical protein DFH09DRAFT_1076883 [Mycena vulgaris]|nr:hypothetical protein DFH09DRAFT_1076883 [Mycena vulgaris]